MERTGTKINSLSERRFSLIVFLLRLGGIPFQMKKISTVYAVYIETLIFCGFTSCVGMLFDVYVHRNDLGHAMTTIRFLIPYMNALWIYIYFRYVRTLTICVTAIEVITKHSITFTALIKRKAMNVKRNI